MSYGTVLAVAGACAALLAWRRSARAHAALRTSLEAAVEDRTRALRRAEDLLHRSERLAAVGQLSAGVAHGINNPAAVIGANLRFLREALAPGAPVPAEAGAAVADAEHALTQIARVARQLRDAGRLAAAPAPLDAAAEVGAAAREAVELARARVGGPAETRVEIAVASPLWAATTHDTLVEVLAALVANGLEALRGQPGSVSVEGRDVAGRVELTVLDDGVGMAPDVVRRVFDPFFTTKREGAAGLGLAVARALIAASGGELGLDSARGKGTRAAVVLPAARPPPLPPPTPVPGGR